MGGGRWERVREGGREGRREERRKEERREKKINMMERGVIFNSTNFFLWSAVSIKLCTVFTPFDNVAFIFSWRGQRLFEGSIYSKAAFVCRWCLILGAKLLNLQ